MRLKAPTCEPPRPFSPATPMRMASLAPTTWPDDLVPATVTVAAAARVLRKSRRFWRVIADPFVRGEAREIRRIFLLYSPSGQPARNYRPVTVFSQALAEADRIPRSLHRRRCITQP